MPAFGACHSHPDISSLEQDVVKEEAMQTVERARPSPLWRAVLVVAGIGLAITGWTLVMTVILSFIGLPVFVGGLALIEGALKWR